MAILPLPRDTKKPTLRDVCESRGNVPRLNPLVAIRAERCVRCVASRTGHWALRRGVDGRRAQGLCRCEETPAMHCGPNLKVLQCENRKLGFPPQRQGGRPLVRGALLASGLT